MSSSGTPAANTGITAAQSAAMQAQQAQQQNAAISAMLRANSVDVKQQIYNRTITAPGAQNNVLQIPFRNVGLVKGFIVKVTCTFSNPGDESSLTEWAMANFFSNVSLYDMDNYQRINTTGYHLEAIATAKEGFPNGAALLLTAMDTPVSYGNNYDCLETTNPVPAVADDVPGTGTGSFYFYVPCAYANDDLRGSIWAGVVNATAYLQLTINPAPDAGGGDPTLAIYSGGETAIASATVTVYQHYLDQVPRYPPNSPQAGAPILPPLDIATQYRLNSTSLTGVSVGQDFPIPFSNFQQFLSLLAVYDQAGTTYPGTDLNYWALAAANTYIPFKLDPITVAWLGRHRIMTDWPVGAYMFSFRNAPISTNQTGNMQMLMNPITAAAGSTVYSSFESFALITNVLGAASLPAS